MSGRRRLLSLLIPLALLVSGAPAVAAGCARHVADGNDCDWVGVPSPIANTQRYDHGEFIATDFVHDDAGANVDGLTSNNPDPPQPVTGITPNPQDPTSVTVGGAADDGDRFQWSGDFGYPSSSPREYDDVADLLEFREALDRTGLHLLVRLGALSAPDSSVVGIGIDADHDHATGGGSWPRGANLDEQLGYEYFITLWGTGGELTDYTSGTPKTTPIKVVANTSARPPFIETDVPQMAGVRTGVWRTYVGAGVWEATRQAWATPLPAPQQTAAPGSLGRAPAIYNLLFRPYEPNSWWHDTAQAADLANHDIAEDHADIDTDKLRTGASSPQPLPAGLLNLQYRTLALGSGQGVEGVPTGNIWRGPVEPFSLVTPSDQWTNPHLRRFMFFYHCAFCQQNIWPVGVEEGATPNSNNLTDAPLGTRHIQQISDDNDLMVAGSLQRGFGGAGSYGAFPGAEERDLRDVDAAVKADGFDPDPNRTIFAGMSMGGLTTQTLMTLYPDELAAAIGYDSCPLGASGIARIQNIRNIPFYSVNGDTGLDSPCGVTGRQLASTLDGLGYRHLSIEELGRAHDFSLVYESLPIIEKTALREVRDPDPARVTYELDRASEDPKLGLVHDHAYWVSGLGLAKGAASGQIDATALPLSDKLPRRISHLTGTFTYAPNGRAAWVDWQDWDRDLSGHGLADFQPGWTPGPDVTVTTAGVAPPTGALTNGFDLTTTGLASATLTGTRMRLVPDAPLRGTIDAGGPLALTIKGHYGAGTTVAIDDASVAAVHDGHALRVTVPAGKHVLTVDQPARRCVSRRRITVTAPQRIAGHRVHGIRVRLGAQVVRPRASGDRLVATVDLRGRPKGIFHVTITGRTTTGRSLRVVRSFRTCAG